MNEIVKPKSRLDGFEGFNDAVEGVDSQTNRVIQGQIVKFTNEATWVTRDGEELPGTVELIAFNVIRVVQKWGDGQPIETRVLEPGEKFPNLEELNANVPQTEWRDGPDGKLHGPWQAQYLVYLFNPDTDERFTYATGTIGGGIAVRDLVDRVSWKRSLRGEQVYAVVSPSAAPMITRYGTRRRPHFVIKRWVGLSSDRAPPPTESPALSGQQTADLTTKAATDNANKKSAGLNEVKRPSISEEIDDEIDF
jgi:hypothetical protein